MNGLDLFSGIGGIGLALAPWVRTVAYCENDRYAQATLLSRMADGHIVTAPIWDDVCTLQGSFLPDVDIIYGGFPCQDISAAGNGVGMEQGSRSGLFFQITRLVEELRPAYVFLENVPAIRTRGLSRVLSEFTALRYDCRWTVVSAAEVGAPHLRKRWFLLAHAGDDGIRSLSRVAHEKERTLSSEKWNQGAPGPRFGGENVANANGVRQSPGAKERNESRNGIVDSREGLANTAGIRCDQGNSDATGSRSGIGTKEVEWCGSPYGDRWWSVEPNVGRVAHGIPARVDRLRGLGNAVVPLQARVAFERLIGMKALKSFKERGR